MLKFIYLFRKPCITWIIPVKDINNAKNVADSANEL